MPPKKKEPPKINVRPASEMLLQPFRLHCQTRHPMMRLRTKNEHEQDHRLHGPGLDHTHTQEEAAKEEEENA